MLIGKLPNEVLEKIIFSNIKNKREDVLVRAGVGEDNAIIDFGEEVCVMSTDPITGATKDIGGLSIHISCNDVSSSGAEPIGALMTIMAPPHVTEEDIEKIMKDAEEVARELNVEIIGGHTEITDAVNRVIISTTVIGKQHKNKIPNSSLIEVGDKIIMTKSAGIEGTSIIAKELEDILKKEIGQENLDIAKNMDKLISVVKEGMICGEIGVNYMHDITEGGVLGAVWEASKAIGKGVKIYEDLIPIEDITAKICSFLNIDPLRLISSGSMLMIAKEKNMELIEEVLSKEGINVSIIGEIIEEDILMENDGKVKQILPPASDELYKALSLKN